MAGRIGGLMADLNYDKKAAVKALKAKRGQTTPRSEGSIDIINP